MLILDEDYSPNQFINDLLANRVWLRCTLCGGKVTFGNPSICENCGPMNSDDVYDIVEV